MDVIKSAIPVWIVQFHLSGGARRLSTVLAATIAILVFGTLVTRRLAIDQPFSTVAGWITVFLAWAQSGILVFFGSNMIFRAVSRDADSKMIESHRITPMADFGVTFGYLLGPTIQALAVFVTVGIGGAIVSLLGQAPLGAWAVGHVVLLAACLNVWALVIFIGMKPPKPINPGGLIVAAATLSMPISFVPGIAFLLNLYGVFYGAFLLAGRATPNTVLVFIVLGISIAMTFFWLAVAAVKYRRPDLPALGSYRGLILLTITCIVGTIGLTLFDEVRRRFVPMGGTESVIEVQWIASLFSAILLASVPIASAVQTRMLAARGSALRGSGDRMSELLVVLLCALVILTTTAGLGWKCWRTVIPAAVTSHGIREIWFWTAIATVIALLTLCPLFVLVQRFAKSANALIGLFVVLAWALPPVSDLARAEHFREYSEPVEFSLLFGSSPAGTIIAAWTAMPIPLFPGIIVQAVLMFALWILSIRERRRFVARSTA
jgi:hypothetical protein